MTLSMSNNIKINKKYDHPERLPDEVFVSNIYKPDDDYYERYRLHDDLPGYKTLRIGEIAYDSNGKPLKDMRPTFAKITEVDEWYAYLSKLYGKEQIPFYKRKDE